MAQQARDLVQMTKQQGKQGEPEGRGDQRGQGRQVDVLPIREPQEGDRGTGKRAEDADQKVAQAPAPVGVQVLAKACDPGQKGASHHDTGVGVAKPQRHEHPAPRQQKVAKIAILAGLQHPLCTILYPDAEQSRGAAPRHHLRIAGHRDAP